MPDGKRQRIDLVRHSTTLRSATAYNPGIPLAESDSSDGPPHAVGSRITAELPDGIVTSLFADVEGGTRLWEEAPDSMMDALRLHDGVIRTAVTGHNGVLVKPRGEGDSQFAVFGSAVDAVEGSAQIQRDLAKVDWPTPRLSRVRASLHTSRAELELGNDCGSSVNRAARLRAITHGGQTLLSASTFELVRDHLPDGVSISDLGAHRLKDLNRPENVFQLDLDGLDGPFPALISLGSVPNNLRAAKTRIMSRSLDPFRFTR